MSKTVFMFPGQGAQYIGMAHDIARAYPESMDVFRVAGETTGRNIQAMTFDGPEAELNLTENTQPCLLAAELAFLLAAEINDLHADAWLGFSLGEWTALAAAGVVTLPDAFRLVSLRAQAMQRAVPVGQGGMAVILGKTAEEVSELCERADGYVEPSNFNCPGQISVAGSAEGIESLLKLAAKDNVVAKRIEVSIPSHCKLMGPAAEELRCAVKKVAFAQPLGPIVMNCCAEAVTDAAQIRENVIRQLTNPVYMDKSICLLLDEGFDTFVELGPGKTLSGFVRKCAKAHGAGVHIFSVCNLETLEDCVRRLKGGKNGVE